MRRNSLLLLALLSGVEAQALNPLDDPANPPSKPASSTPAPVPTAAPAPSAAPPPPAPAPAPAPESAAKKSVPAKPVPKADVGDDEEQPSKKAPRRFIPTEKGNADEDIPYPVDI